MAQENPYPPGAPAPETEPPPQVKPFAAWLQEQRAGALHAELSAALREVVGAALEHGKAGAITLTVGVRPAGNIGMRTIFVTDKVVTKVPEGERGESLFFADEHGNVSRTDPRQQRLPLYPAGADPEGTA